MADLVFRGSRVHLYHNYKACNNLILIALAVVSLLSNSEHSITNDIPTGASPSTPTPIQTNLYQNSGMANSSMIIYHHWGWQNSWVILSTLAVMGKWFYHMVISSLKDAFTCTTGGSIPASSALADIWSKTFATIFTMPVANHCNKQNSSTKRTQRNG